MPVARLNSYENKVLSTNNISSIKRVLIRKFVKFHIVVVQQQRQRNKQKNVMHVQSLFFANEAFGFLINTVLHAVCFLLFLNAITFYTLDIFMLERLSFLACL